MTATDSSAGESREFPRSDNQIPLWHAAAAAVCWLLLYIWFIWFWLVAHSGRCVVVKSGNVAERDLRILVTRCIDWEVLIWKVVQLIAGIHRGARLIRHGSHLVGVNATRVVPLRQRRRIWRSSLLFRRHRRAGRHGLLLTLATDAIRSLRGGGEILREPLIWKLRLSLSYCVHRMGQRTCSVVAERWRPVLRCN